VSLWIFLLLGDDALPTYVPTSITKPGDGTGDKY
jgi:hypothetical protein